MYYIIFPILKYYVPGDGDILHPDTGKMPYLFEGHLTLPVFLGMFATVAGISQRAPVHWSENVIGAAVCFPYVIALDHEFITVHSMLDQQQKQTLPFKEGHILQDFEGTSLLTEILTKHSHHPFRIFLQ